MAIRGASLSTTSVAASSPSDSSANDRSPPAPARWCTSRLSMCARRSASLVSSVGTTTRVRRWVGTPSSSARPGSPTGPKRRVTRRLTSTLATSVAGKKPASASATSQPGRVP